MVVPVANGVSSLLRGALLVRVLLVSTERLVQKADIISILLLLHKTNFF
jgi:hypothetical protein